MIWICGHPLQFSFEQLADEFEPRKEAFHHGVLQVVGFEEIDGDVLWQFDEPEESEEVVAERPFVVFSLEQFSEGILVAHEQPVLVVNKQAVIEER